MYLSIIIEEERSLSLEREESHEKERKLEEEGVK